MLTARASPTQNPLCARASLASQVRTPRFFFNGTTPIAHNPGGADDSGGDTDELLENPDVDQMSEEDQNHEELKKLLKQIKTTLKKDRGPYDTTPEQTLELVKEYIDEQMAELVSESVRQAIKEACAPQG